MDILNIFAYNFLNKKITTESGQGVSFNKVIVSQETPIADGNISFSIIPKISGKIKIISSIKNNGSDSDSVEIKVLNHSNLIARTSKSINGGVTNSVNIGSVEIDAFQKYDIQISTGGDMSVKNLSWSGYVIDDVENMV